MQKVLSQVVQEYERAVIFRLVPLHLKFKNYEKKKFDKSERNRAF